MKVEPQLINLMNHAPLFVYKNEGLELKVYAAQDLFMIKKYLACNFTNLHRSTAVLFLSAKINSEKKDFVLNVPQFDKRFVNEWTKEQWVEIVYLLHRKNKIETDLEDIQAALMNMQMFSELRKDAKAKQKELKQAVKSVDRAIQQFLADAREKGNEKIVYRD